jgi:iron complex outermembrane recepter protein
VSKSIKAQYAALFCVSAISLIISREAAGQVQSPSPSTIPPVQIQPPLQAPAAAGQESRSGQGAKPRRTRSARRRAPANGAGTRGNQEVAVSAPAPTRDQVLQRDGTAEQGYRAQTLSRVGPFGQSSILNMPFSYTVFPKDLIENLQTGLGDRLYDVDPFTQPSVPSNRGFNTLPLIRGFQPSQLFEGLPEAPGFNPPSPDLEDKERVEVLNGLSGFLYGNSSFAQPGGAINFVLKRPTATQFTNVTVGDYGGSSIYTHVDTGGPIGSNVGYRFNALWEGGQTPVDDQRLGRQLFSGALDFHLTDNFLLQVDASHSRRREDGTNALWSVASGLSYPTSINQSQLWGQKFSFDTVTTDHAGAKVTWDINDNVTFRADTRYYTYNFNQLFASNQITSETTYNTSIFQRNPAILDALSGDAFVDIKAQTGGIGHVITAGYFGSRGELNSPTSGFQFLTSAVGLPLSSPTFLPAPAATCCSPTTLTNLSEHQNAVIADKIKFSDRLEMLLGLTDTNVNAQSFGTTNTQYTTNKVTPTAALIFKPLPFISTYVTYIEHLEDGGIAATQATGINGTLPVTNANQAQPAIVDKQIEVGIKADLAGLQPTLALFDIKRASNVYLPNGTTSYTFSTSGMEEHKGIEVGVSGKVLPNLTLYGGFTVMENRIIAEPDAPTLVGLQPAGVSEQMVKLYAEYQPGVITGLTLTGGVAWVGPFYADNLNTQKVDGYVIGSVGARYKTMLAGHETIWRFDVTNIANTNYWISPNYIGSPRTYMASGTIKF